MSTVDAVNSVFNVDVLSVNSQEKGVKINIPSKGNKVKKIVPVFEGMTYILVNKSGEMRRYVKKENGKLSSIGNIITNKNIIFKIKERMAKKYSDHDGIEK